MMKTYFVMTLMAWALFGAPPSRAADCDRITAADLNSRIETNFSLMDGSGTQEASKQGEVDALKREFSEAGELHSRALENNDQASLTKACDTYRSILEAQAVLSE